MRHILFFIALAVLPLWGGAGPAHGQAGTALRPGGSERMNTNKDLRRDALRQALVPQQEAVPSSAESGSGRHLTPVERAELRRQLRDQSLR